MNKTYYIHRYLTWDGCESRYITYAINKNIIDEIRIDVNDGFAGALCRIDWNDAKDIADISIFIKAIANQIKGTSE